MTELINGVDGINMADVLQLGYYIEKVASKQNNLHI